MPNVRKPRCGSMQFWPRKRARRMYPRVKAWAQKKEPQLLGFAGYKVGMTHLMATEAYKNSPLKGQEICVPGTIIECPPLKIAYIRFYNKFNKVVTQVYSKNLDKDLGRKIRLPKKETKKLEDVKPQQYADVAAVCYTVPKGTGLGKKKPELFEVRLGGKVEEKLSYLTENLEKEILISDVFKDGDIVDIHAVTKGKGYQGPVKRFGIALKNHKAEKGTRAPGSISGGWVAQAHMMYRTAHAGQMGFHTRTEYNKTILKIGDNPEDVNQIGGVNRYGVVKGTYIIIKGSVGGAKKRLVRFNFAIRPTERIALRVPTVSTISKTKK